MKLAVASGKGGTGKTTLSVAIAKTFDGPVQLLDCDVEEPNSHIFLKLENKIIEKVNVPYLLLIWKNVPTVENVRKFANLTQ